MVLQQSWGGPKVTKDGVTVAKDISFSDPYEELGAQLVHQVAAQTNDLAGDGTTTATVLTRAIVQAGCRLIVSGMNPMDIRRGIIKATDHILTSLDALSTPVQSNEMIRQVGSPFLSLFSFVFTHCSTLSPPLFSEPPGSVL